MRGNDIFEAILGMCALAVIAGVFIYAVVAAIYPTM